MRSIRDHVARRELRVAARVVAAGMGIVLAAGLVSFAAEKDDKPSSPSDKSLREPISVLIRQLGDNDCTRREMAAVELAKFGIAAKKELMAATEDPDLEIRIRARLLLATVIAGDYERRLQEFIADTSGEKGTDLPAWSQFKAHFGNGEGSRKLFVEMQKADPELLAAVEKGPKSIGPILDRRVQSAHLAEAFDAYRQGTRNFPIGSVMAIIFAATEPNANIADSVGAWIAMLPQANGSASTAIRTGAFEGVPKKIVARWIGRPLEKGMQETAQRNLQMGLSHRLSEAVVPARMIVAQPVQGIFKQQAILALAKYGEKKADLPRLESLLEETSACGHLAVPNNNGPTAIQVRDIALCAAIRLSGQEPKEYGYEFLVSNEVLLYNPNTIGFKDAEGREKALAKWREWSASQKKQ